MYNLLSVEADAKTIKGEAQGYLTGILYLAPHDLAGNGSVCPWSTPGCRETCLFTAGHGGMNSVQRARIRKTMLWHEDKRRFLEAIDEDIMKLKRIAAKRGMVPCVRLNGTSDIPWEFEFNIDCYGIQFYDYTKSRQRMRHMFESTSWPTHYDLTFSHNEVHSGLEEKEILQRQGNVAVVFDTKKGKDLPSEYLGYPVIDGDLSDLRFLDPKGVIVGLRAKGKARKDTTGFVVKA